MNGQLTTETLEILKGIQENHLRKDATTTGITHATGVLFYDLAGPAALLYPVPTPLRNSIPRVGATGAGQGDAAHWKAITAINVGNLFIGVSEGERNAQIQLSEKDFVASYKGIGLENYSTFEAKYGAEGFDDAWALASLTCLQSVMLGEEDMTLHGNSGLALGQTGTPTVAVAVGVGTITAGNNKVYCVALTYDGYVRSGGKGVVGSAGVLQPTYSRTNVSGTVETISGGVAKISAVSGTVVTTGSNLGISASVAAVKGAIAYAWFLDVGATGAANAFLAAITLTNTVTLLANPTSTYAANATGLSVDNSTNALAYDGLMSLALQGNCFFKSLDGATLTSDGDGGIVEIDAILKSMWDTARVSPTKIRVGSQQIGDITKKVVSASSGPVYRINLDPGKAGQGNVTGGNLVTSYLNKFALGGVREIPIELQPNMPDGTILFDQERVPDTYPNPRIGFARRIRTRQDYYEMRWPLVKRQLQVGVYADQCLQVSVPYAMGIMSNVAAG